MTDLTRLTIAEARKKLRARDISATELTEAYLGAIDAANPSFNAYVAVTHDKARDMATASDARLAAGTGGALEGIPLGIKDLFATEGVHTQACSHVLDGFKPRYESTVTANLWADGAVMLGKLNMDEFAMGSSNETSYYGPVVNPWRRSRTETVVTPTTPYGRWRLRLGRRRAPEPDARQCAAGARRLVGRLGDGGLRLPLRRRHRHRYRWLDPPAGGLHRHGRHQADLWPRLALGRRRLRLLARPGRPDRPRRARRRDPAEIHGIGGREGHDLGRLPVPDYEAAIGRSLRGMKVGIPKEYRVEGMPADIEALWQKGIAWLKDAGAEIVDISLPHTKYALPAYYIVAPAEASSNLARYDGVRYGLRVPGKDIVDMYEQTRAAGFGREVKRRIMIGTYVLSAGYYDAYYLQAQKVRTLIKRDFEQVFAAGVDVILTPATPSAAFGIADEDMAADPVKMYLNDIFTVTVNMAGLPGIAVPAGLDAHGLPLGLQLIGRPFDEETLFQTAHVIEQAAGTFQPEKWW